MALPRQSPPQWISLAEDLLTKDGRHSFRPSDLNNFHAQLKLPKKIGRKEFTDQLTALKVVREMKLTSPYEQIRRFVTKGATAYEVAASIRQGAYISHESALTLHGIGGAQSSRVFVNKEQSPKPQTEVTSQEAIDKAFANRQRHSNNIYKSSLGDFILLSGKYTERLGVETCNNIPVTNLERTLIDIAVRPHYAGGPQNVLNAYKAVARQLSVLKLTKILEKMSFAYPYHQSIGFYLQSAGVPLPQLNPLRDFGVRFSFYLDYGEKTRAFDEYWKVYYPTTLAVIPSIQITQSTLSD